MKKVHHAQSLLPKKFWVDLLEDIILTDDYEGTSPQAKTWSWIQHFQFVTYNKMVCTLNYLKLKIQFLSYLSNRDQWKMGT